MRRFQLRGLAIVVTGGAGFIGSHLVDRLVEMEVRCIDVIDDLSSGRTEHLAPARRSGIVRLHPIDATSGSAMARFFTHRRVDVVFDLATIPLPISIVRPRWSAERIAKMATVIAELGRRAAYGTLVHCSSSEVYGTAVEIPMSETHPLNVETPYAAGKAAADLIVRSYWETFELDAAIVRPFNTYGPRQNEGAYGGLIPMTLRRIRAGEPPVILGDGEQTRDFTYVGDTVDGIVETFRSPRSRRRVMNLGTGRETSVNEVVHFLCEIVGYRGAPVRLPARPGDVRRHRSDASLAKELIDYRPRVGIEEGLRRTAEWYLRRFK